MIEINHGGPAFPVERQTITEQYGHIGMTLRALGPVSIHTCTPPQGRTFDDYGNKIV